MRNLLWNPRHHKKPKRAAHPGGPSLVKSPRFSRAFSFVKINCSLRQQAPAHGGANVRSAQSSTQMLPSSFPFVMVTTP